MIEITFKNANGQELEQTLLVDAEYIMKDDYLKDYLLEQFIEDNNECICSLNESQSHCECEGILGEIHISTLADIV